MPPWISAQLFYSSPRCRCRPQLGWLSGEPPEFVIQMWSRVKGSNHSLFSHNKSIVKIHMLSIVISCLLADVISCSGFFIHLAQHFLAIAWSENPSPTLWAMVTVPVTSSMVFLMEMLELTHHTWPPWLKKMKAPRFRFPEGNGSVSNLTSSASYMKWLKFRHDVTGLWHCDEDLSCFGMWSSMSNVYSNVSWSKLGPNKCREPMRVMLCLKNHGSRNHPCIFCTPRRCCGRLRNPAQVGRWFMIS